MQHSPLVMDDSGVPELTLEETIARVWQVNSEAAQALTQQERQAVELYVSRYFTGAWYRKQMLKGGWKHCLEMAWTGPNLYGLA